MTDNIKNELHQLIDNCDNELLLAETKTLLESEKDMNDWWNELSEEDKNMVMESEAEYEKGNFVSHKEFTQQFEAWKKK